MVRLPLGLPAHPLRVIATRPSKVDAPCRLFASSYRSRASSRRRLRSKPKARHEETTKTKPSDGLPAAPAAKSTVASGLVRDWILPIRYRFPLVIHYTSEQGWALAYRLPLFVVAVTLLVAWDETSPISFLHIQGPSMIPTMAPDRSEVWLTLHRRWWWRQPRRGDVVGFAHPDHPRNVSCKRVVGVAGDEVLRYGEYIDLYAKHDPRCWGISPLDRSRYPWVTKDWDTATEKHPHATHKVPEHHVWLEADCPGFGIDSRQIGPVPVQWLRGRIVARVWPLGAFAHTERPAPVPLSRDNLRKYNVHKVALQLADDS